MKKHRFAFIYKYIILAAALACVLCFAFVFARYVTGTNTGVTADIASFDVKAAIIEPEYVGESSDKGIIVVSMTNNGDVAVKYQIEIQSDTYDIVIETAAEGEAAEGSDSESGTVSFGEGWDVDGCVVTGVTSINPCTVLYVKMTASFSTYDASKHIEDVTPGDGKPHPDVYTQEDKFTLTFSYEQAE